MNRFLLCVYDDTPTFVNVDNVRERLCFQMDHSQIFMIRVNLWFFPIKGPGLLFLRRVPVSSPSQFDSMSISLVLCISDRRLCNYDYTLTLRFTNKSHVLCGTDSLEALGLEGT